MFPQVLRKMPHGQVDSFEAHQGSEETRSDVGGAEGALETVWGHQASRSRDSGPSAPGEAA